jgi:prepilin-type N-terminal cleavage/methylation domain-containing protein
MHIFTHQIRGLRKSLARKRGFTLVEMLITMGIFGFAMSAMLAAYIFGLKQDQLVQSKLGASDESRRSFEKVARDIRSANNHAVGNYVGGTNGGFTPIGNSGSQVGNALQIHLTATPNAPSITYFFDTSGASGTWTLNRLHTGDAAPTVIASHLQNSATFSAENCAGATLPSLSDKDVIHFTLDFCEYQYPLTKVGTGYHYDRYVMDFRATPHVPGGK